MMDGWNMQSFQLPIPKKLRKLAPPTGKHAEWAPEIIFLINLFICVCVFVCGVFFG